eukprot:3310651-Prymnesium_polylepis.1
MAVAKPMLRAAATRTYDAETRAVAQAGGAAAGRSEMAGVQKAARALAWSERTNVPTGPHHRMTR